MLLKGVDVAVECIPSHPGPPQVSMVSHLLKDTVGTTSRILYMDLSPIWDELYEHVAMYSPVWIVGSLGTETVTFPHQIKQYGGVSLK